MATARTWQLEIERLRGEGRTAALLGTPGLAWDVFARRARIAETAQRAYARLTEPAQTWVAAYVDGVNAAFADGASARELTDLDAEPGRWEPWTPLSVFWVQQILFASYPSKLWRQHLLIQLGEDGLAAFPMEGLPASGSNAFVVGGERTANGMPLIGGDPHRLLESPNIYAQVHLACDEFDVVGYTFPGVPGVQHFGHTGSVAWAITNAMGDYQDVYVEQLVRAGDAVTAHGPDGIEPVARTVEVVEVRGADSVEVELLVTERGPVVIGGPDEPVAMSVRTPSLAEGDLGFEALLPLLHARTVADVDAALTHWVEPVNNVVIADTKGDVLHRVAGLVPRRREQLRVLPVDASDGENAWDGYVSDLPRTPVAASGQFVTSNDRGSAAYDAIGNEFAPKYRHDRIFERFEGRTGLKPADAADVILDHRQNSGGTLLAAIEALTDLSPEGAAVRERVLAWDGQMAADSDDAGVYIAIREALVKRVCAAEVLQPLREAPSYGTFYSAWMSVEVRVATRLHKMLATDQPWLGLDLRTLLHDAVEDVAAGPRPGPWGEAHVYHPLHALEQFGLPVDRTAVTGSPLAGDSESVAATHTTPGTSAVVRGPVARYVWDLGDRGASLWAVPLGASGDPDSPHHTDQFEPWDTGRLVPVITDFDALEKETP